MSWYLRSFKDHDTHHVAVLLLWQGAVAADCGVEFRPIVLPTGRLALRGGPAEPRQVCPTCVGGAR
jgi:hypothetical protein